MADAVVAPKVLAINRILFPAMQFGRIAGVEALCFASFHLCQQMKVTRHAGRDRRALAPSEKKATTSHAPFDEVAAGASTAAAGAEATA